MIVYPLTRREVWVVHIVGVVSASVLLLLSALCFFGVE